LKVAGIEAKTLYYLEFQICEGVGFKLPHI